MMDVPHRQLSGLMKRHRTAAVIWWHTGQLLPAPATTASKETGEPAMSVGNNDQEPSEITQLRPMLGTMLVAVGQTSQKHTRY